MIRIKQPRYTSVEDYVWELEQAGYEVSFVGNYLKKTEKGISSGLYSIFTINGMDYVLGEKDGDYCFFEVINLKHFELPEKYEWIAQYDFDGERGVTVYYKKKPTNIKTIKVIKNPDYKSK